MAFKLKPDTVHTSENDVEADCLAALRRRGYYVIRLHSGKYKTLDGRFVILGEPGIPDYAVLHPNRTPFFMEVKSPKGQLSGDQSRKIWEIETFFRIPTLVVSDVNHLVQLLDAK